MWADEAMIDGYDPFNPGYSAQLTDCRLSVVLAEFSRSNSQTASLHSECKQTSAVHGP